MKTKTNDVSEKEKTTALILSLLGIIGVAGMHRFYAGKIGTGLLWLFTAGLFYVGTIVDIVKVANGNFKDKNGAVISK